MAPPVYHSDSEWLGSLRILPHKVLIVVIGLSIILATILLKPRDDMDSGRASVVAGEGDARSDAEPALTVGQASSVIEKKAPNQAGPRKAGEGAAIRPTTGAKTVVLAPEATARTGGPASSRRKLQKPPPSRYGRRDFQYDRYSPDDPANARGRLYSPGGRYQRPWAW